MEPDILQLGATFIIAIGLMELLKYAIGLLAKRKNGNGSKNNIQDIDIAVLKNDMKTVLTNHIPHINEKLEKLDKKIDKILEKI